VPESVKDTQQRIWVRWSAAQFASIFCLVAACMYIFVGISRSVDPETPPWLAVGIFVQMALFYLLHWRFQGWANDLDPTRSDRLVALITARRSRLDQKW
jgi:fatty acid desaturase